MFGSACESPQQKPSSTFFTALSSRCCFRGARGRRGRASLSSSEETGPAPTPAASSACQGERTAAHTVRESALVPVFESFTASRPYCVKRVENRECQARTSDRNHTSQDFTAADTETGTAMPAGPETLPAGSALGLSCCTHICEGKRKIKTKFQRKDWA